MITTQPAPHARPAQPADRTTPGLPAAIIITIITAIGIGAWTQARPHEPTAPTEPRIAEVAPQDLPAALDTIDAPQDQLARAKSNDPCKTHLAWITLRRSPGQPEGRIRLQSGHYYSPAFTLTDAPIRVALPYPAPYPTGRGTITVVGTTADAIIALTPPWHVPAEGAHTLDVTWTPADTCPAAKP